MTHPDRAHEDAAPGTEQLQEMARKMHASGLPVTATPQAGSGLGTADRTALAQPFTIRRFNGEAKWWAAGYGRCEITLPDAGWRFRGEGGAFPGAGAYSGDIYKDDLTDMVNFTTSCLIISAAFYVNITFLNAGAVEVGMFHGGGMGVGGGLFAGSWARI